jgi:NitT/TauT family transport system substrate-binding protein
MSLFLLVLYSGSCRESSPNPIRIGYSPFPGHLFLDVAERQGFFQAEGVAVELREFSSFSAAVQAYEAGRLDALASSFSGLLQLAQRMKGAKAIAVLAYSEGAEGLIAQPEIRTLDELRGKRIGISPWGVGGYLWARLRERAGLAENEVHLVTLSPADGQRAFLRREIEALLTFEPWLTSTVRRARANVLFTSRELPGEIADVLSVQEHLVRERREDCRRLLRAYFRAVDYGREHPEEIVRLLAERWSLSREDARAMIESIRFLTREESLRALGTPEEWTKWRQLAETHRRLNIVREVEDVARLFDPSLIRERP